MKQRLEIDRLWRTPSQRRQFEADTGLAPIGVGQAARDEAVNSGHLQRYQEYFIGWAYRRLAEK